MTEDRAQLAARIAEMMEWDYDAESDAWIVPEDADPVEDWVEADSLLTWWGYGVLDQWMREQGYRRVAFHWPDGHVAVNYTHIEDLVEHPGAPQYGANNEDGDEPYAAALAALRAAGRDSGATP